MPHSEVPGSPIARISPGLFAACHVLHRLSVPRHPPDALHSRLITGIPVAGNAAQPPRTGPNPRGPPPKPGTNPNGLDRPPAVPLRASLAGAMPTGEALLRRATALHPERGATSVAPVAASHEDTSPDTPPLDQHPRAPAKTVVSASVTSQLSLHPSINNPAAVARDGRSASPNAALGAAFSATPRCGGGERIRTDDLLLAKQALSQLSYTPVQGLEDRDRGSNF